MKTYKKVLTIAGSDSGGGAGIQADLKTISALGCYGSTAITAITVQNTKGVYGIHGIPPATVYEQISAVLKDIGTDAIKIGMLHSAEIIKAVVNALKENKSRKIVLDPVMVAASGDKLIEDNTIEALTGELFPLVDVITPNLSEAEILLGRPLKNQQEMEENIQRLLEYGNNGVLLKGGHLESESLSDIFIQKGDTAPVVITNKKIETNNIHGSGCTLSSAIASYMAHGLEIKAAVTKGVEYVHQAILYGKDYKTGAGSGPLNHFFQPEKLK